MLVLASHNHLAFISQLVFEMLPPYIHVIHSIPCRYTFEISKLLPRIQFQIAIHSFIHSFSTLKDGSLHWLTRFYTSDTSVHPTLLMMQQSADLAEEDYKQAMKLCYICNAKFLIRCWKLLSTSSYQTPSISYKENCLKRATKED